MSKRRRKLTVEKWVDLGERVMRSVTFGKSEREFMEMVDDAINSGRTDIGQLIRMYHENAVREKFVESGMQAYLFDNDFFASIGDEDWGDLLPDVIRHAPHDCFYMHLPYDEASAGIVVWLRNVSDFELFKLDNEPYHLFEEAKSHGKGVYYGDVSDGNEAFVNDGTTVWRIETQAIPKELSMMIDDVDYGIYPNRLYVNGIAYLCSKNADINKVYEPPSTRGSKSSKKYSTATWHEVGYRVGSELRKYRRYRNDGASHKGGAVRPHMRRAHWHHYWTGPRDGERQLVLKWIPPILVASKNGDVSGVTGHLVASDAEEHASAKEDTCRRR